MTTAIKTPIQVKLLQVLEAFNSQLTQFNDSDVIGTVPVTELKQDVMDCILYSIYGIDVNSISNVELAEFNGDADVDVDEWYS